MGSAAPRCSTYLKGNQVSAQPMHDEPLLSIRTLTAQVMTVYMDNRQVTLSVARQLDRVSFWAIEPWGRIEIAGPVVPVERGWGGESQMLPMVIGCSGGYVVTAAIPAFRDVFGQLQYCGALQPDQKSRVDAALGLPKIVLAGLK